MTNEDAVSWPIGRGHAPTLQATEIERLTSTGRIARYPSLAPDGSFFVYSAAQDTGRAIYLQRFGGQRALLLTGGGGVTNIRPSISPDGEWIVFQSSRDGGGIYVMAATGENVRRVHDGGHHPAWSPDGTRIVASTDDWSQPWSRNGRGRLFTVPVDGGEPTYLTPEVTDAVQPDWSPLGDRIVFWGVHHSSGQRDLFTVPAESGEPVALTDDDALDYAPRYDEEGRWVWFVSNRAGSAGLAADRVDDLQQILGASARSCT